MSLGPVCTALAPENLSAGALSTNKFIIKINSTIYLMILIMYYKY